MVNVPFGFAFKEPFASFPTDSCLGSGGLDQEMLLSLGEPPILQPIIAISITEYVLGVFQLSSKETSLEQAGGVGMVQTAVAGSLGVHDM